MVLKESAFIFLISPFLDSRVVKFFTAFLVQTMTPKRHFEINWPLKGLWSKQSLIAIFFHKFLAKEEEQEPNVENNDEIDMGEDEDVDVESDEDDLDTKAEHGMFID